ncbi:hypothetical protein [Bacillus pseudomycoides]|uniref:hypothetical protein n=1 Tax=Bacillus cereus group TaxID=86661 RepID=UPI0023D9EAAB|nr:hypothetical protein [Bacillus pseudomycoides]MDF2084521.1 hypothetical protein [Bacillus pseudomycoides]
MERPVVIEEFTPDWALQFKEEQRLLKGIMGDKAITIEHIGAFRFICSFTNARNLWSHYK